MVGVQYSRLPRGTTTQAQVRRLGSVLQRGETILPAPLA